MSDLYKDYFKRDLSDAEERALMRSLMRSEADALRFSGEAKKAYAMVGFFGIFFAAKNALAGSLSKAGIGGAAQAIAAKAVLGASLLTVAGGGAIWYGMEEVVEEEIAAQVQPPLPDIAKPAGDKEGTYLSIRLDMPSSRHMRVKIFDATGQMVRDYGSLTLDAGIHRLNWDGTIQDGSMASPGSYTVEVDFGSGVMRRKLEVHTH